MERPDRLLRQPPHLAEVVQRVCPLRRGQRPLAPLGEVGAPPELAAALAPRHRRRFLRLPHRHHDLTAAGGLRTSPGWLGGGVGVLLRAPAKRHGVPAQGRPLVRGEARRRPPQADVGEQVDHTPARLAGVARPSAPVRRDAERPAPVLASAGLRVAGRTRPRAVLAALADPQHHDRVPREDRGLHRFDPPHTGLQVASRVPPATRPGYRPPATPPPEISGSASRGASPAHASRAARARG